MFKLNSHPNDNINILIIIKQTPQKNVKKPSSAFKRETKYKKKNENFNEIKHYHRENNKYKTTKHIDH